VECWRGGGTRTHTTLPSRDFKSLASISFATAAGSPREIDEMLMAEDGARAQHDAGLARLEERLGDRAAVCGCAFDDDVGQRLEFADRHNRNGATEM
jgi:hypothetical protein